MDQNRLISLLEQYKQDQRSIDEVLQELKSLPFESVDHFANLDHHRALRTGFPEVIMGQGKTAQQILQIFKRLQQHSQQVLATRVIPEIYAQIGSSLPEATYDPVSRVLYCDTDPGRVKHPGILVVTAGTSDIPVAEEAAITAEIMGNQVQRIYDVGVAGLHRLLNRLPELQQARVIIVAAGMEGALPSVVGGLVSAPIIAVPTSVGYGASFQGLSALLGMLNSCANGVSVVNIDNGFGAGSIAARINRLVLQENSSAAH